MLIKVNLSASEPRTHVLVIGVGYYPHFSDGSEPAKTIVYLEQLTSAPRSAREFARWVVEAFNPSVPLGTVELLLSEEEDSHFSAKGVPVGPVVKANRTNITEAVRGWKKRCASHPDNQVIFYFCGHGLDDGHRLALLASDFPNSEGMVFENAIDFYNILEGMGTIDVSNQWFFVDACRNKPEGGFLGDVKFEPSRILEPGMAKGSVIYSTLPGERARGGRPGEMTLFTTALLACLDRFGGRKEGNSWVVKISELFEKINEFLRWKVDESEEEVQSPEGRILGKHHDQVIHVLQQPPLLPIRIYCDPKQATAVADLYLRLESTGKEVDRRAKPAPYPWKTTAVPGALYDAHADFSDGHPYNSASERFLADQALLSVEITA